MIGAVVGAVVAGATISGSLGLASMIIRSKNRVFPVSKLAVST